MKTTKILSKEHEVILKVADALEKECDALEDNKGKEIDKEFFKKAIYFIQHYADDFHHAKEEKILFKEMLKDSVQENLHCNPIDQMLYEHDLGRDFVKGLKEGLEKGDKKKVIENARNYAQLIREHIFKEDNILYPMAEGVLDQKVEKSMLKEFEKADKSKKSEEKKCLSIAKELEKR